MTSVEEDGVHTHEPCTECGVAEAVDGSLCEECAIRAGLADAAAGRTRPWADIRREIAP